MFQEVIELIKEYDTVIIHRHTNPDGDALGSQIGLKALINTNLPEKKVYVVGDAARRYSFMEGSVMDEIDDSLYSGALAIILDTSAISLISDQRYKSAAKTVRIDHHIFVEKIADVEVVDPTFESCCGLIAAFAEECGLKLSSLAAKSLYTGMVTDSGRFRYDSVTPRTFRLAAYLNEADFSASDIFSELYADDLDAIKLRARYVLKINVTENRVAYIYTTAEEFDALGVDSFTISRGMVNTMAEIRGVDSWVNFTEADGAVLCEIRSKKYNINPIAVKYGGGGHAKASGATLADRDQAMALLADLEELSKQV